jgi:hypothetical protein
MTETIYLCGRAKCCPKVELSAMGMTISEFGQTVYLTKKEAKELLNKLNKKYGE